METGRLPSAESEEFPLNCWIMLVGKDLKHFSAFSSCLARISFFSFSAFNSLRNCAFDLFPNGQSTRCWMRLVAAGRTSGFGWIICCNKGTRLLNLWYNGIRHCVKLKINPYDTGLQICSCNLTPRLNWHFNALQCGKNHKINCTLFTAIFNLLVESLNKMQTINNEFIFLYPKVSK